MKNVTYSHGHFTNQTFLDAVDFTDEIVNANFSQEGDIKDVFPAGATATFTDCNLDNCNIPAGCVVNGGTNERIKVQNDLLDWVVNKSTGLPEEPTAKADLLARGLSIDPANIPGELQTKSPIQTDIEGK
jgi:hypothetical protein